ncbi:MAG: TldD/PmbA family protein [Candidatus Zixiibacteriota bacterium]|nr:MAG: TldD/PmbA family protein [candidate division Zixibacteria bacterium]
MIGKDTLFTTFEKVARSSRADETEIVFVGNSTGLTRYANSTIHQNVHESDAKILFRSVIGKKIGVASTNSMAINDLRATLKNSLEIAKYQKDNEHFSGLPEPETYACFETCFTPTSEYKPMDRARMIKKIFVRANRRKFTVAGSFSTGDGEIAVFNTRGVRCYQPVTSASINIVAMSNTSSGYASGLSRNVEDIDPVALAEIAVEKAFRSKKPKPLEAGEYEVILEPAAVAEMMEWVNYIAFGSKAFEDKTSFMSNTIGQKVMDDSVTIYDDGNDSLGIAMPFDFEGVPKQKVVFIDKGIPQGVVYDRTSGNRAGVASTGHALPANEQGEGALALNVFMAPGDKTREEMLASVRRGILVTRFHYVNGYIDTPKAILTGMTRDGTFWIEDGQIKHGIKNLRFTDSVLRAFSQIKGISRDRQLIPSWWDAIGCLVVPALHLGSFKFTGTTDF